MGVMKATQFFWAALTTAMIFPAAFGPNTWIGKNLHCRDYLPIHMFTMCRKDGSGQVGADVLAGSVLYMIMCYHRMWLPAMAFAAFDCAWYGPQALACPATAMAMTFAMF